MPGQPPRTVLSVFGTRPEIIKFAPVLAALSGAPDLRAINVCTSQHVDLAAPFLRDFAVTVHHDLRAMEPGQSLNRLASKVLAGVDAVLEADPPDFVLVQGDTTSALAGALAAFHRRIPVGHIEAGLRSHDPRSPYPEEMNRRLISRLASLHFAATPRNRDALLAEGVTAEVIRVTGNPVVDAVRAVLDRPGVSPQVQEILDRTSGTRRLVLTAHRRENFEGLMAGYFERLRRFLLAHPDVSLIFPVHPNPNVRRIAAETFSGCERLHLVDPLPYPDFIRLLAASWLIVSDSGGVQEEAPTLGKPLLVIRENTERPEAVACGAAQLVGSSPDVLAEALEEAYAAADSRAQPVQNPFGDGRSGPRIVAEVRAWLEADSAQG